MILEQLLHITISVLDYILIHYFNQYRYNVKCNIFKFIFLCSAMNELYRLNILDRIQQDNVENNYYETDTAIEKKNKFCIEINYAKVSKKKFIYKCVVEMKVK